MKVAIPTEDGRIVPRFGGARELTVYDVEIELVKMRQVVTVPRGGISDFLKKEGINAVICGQIGSAGRNLMRTRRIELTYGVFGNADDVMIRYLSGERLGDLEENTLWSLTGREEEDFAQ